MQQDNIDKLLKILDQEDDQPLEYSDDVIDFIEFYGLKRGKYWVKYYTLKKLYNHWSREPLGKNTFVMRMNTHLPSIKRSYVRFYKLNRSSINLSKEAYKFLNTYKNKSRIHVVNHKKALLFLKDKNIKSGKRYPAGAKVIYYMFLDWCEDKGIKLVPIAYKSFCGLMKQTFDCKLDKKGDLYFMITRNLRNDFLTPQRKAAIEKYYAKKENKKPTKQSEIPESQAQLQSSDKNRADRL